MPPQDQILYARTCDDIVILRIIGRGDMNTAPDLKRLHTQLTQQAETSPRYVIDLAECTGLDSTFMGTLASMSLHQNKVHGQPLILTNANATTSRQMETLGLGYMMDIRTGGEDMPRHEDGEAAFKEADTTEVSEVDRIVHMIDSHETLMDVCSGNEIKFRGVVELLEKSLKRAEEEA